MSAFDLSKLEVFPARPYPIGPILNESGVRFSVFSRHATRVWLALFDAVDARAPAWEFEYDPAKHRIGDVWSIFVRGVGEGAYFLYRMDGPFAPKEGHRFDPRIYLLDPYAKAFAGDVHEGTMKCVVAPDDPGAYGAGRRRHAMKDTIIYETHVRGFTMHATSGVSAPGTYQGLIEKLPHLVDLGITAIELLPVQEFGETYIGRCSLLTGQELTNYWGYNSIGFFAPAGRYACSAVNREHLDEFRRMVDAIHDAGLEVILDVVFNHTSEGNELGPTLCFRGIDNSIYYLLDDEGGYLNYSGCGNTLHCNHPLVRDFILDCLRYWVAVMHVDGFRFDLASILGRDARGNVLQDAPLIERISQDPVIRDTKLIAEAWDAGGAYQVGSFGGVRWAEWNGRYRDDVRRYWRGDAGTRGTFASRIMGSADIYEWAGRSPEHSINFVTCHDGFTLRDLVTYREKRNWANGEDNRDGASDNFSMNCGVEGETDFPEFLSLRLRMQKNFLATLFLSLGVPMLLGGDEFGRTQKGNNNAYCQDNDISWFDWRLLEKNKELHRFCKEVIAFRKRHPCFTRGLYFNGAGQGPEEADVLWFDETGGPVAWDAPDTPLACRIRSAGAEQPHLCLLFNNTPHAIAFRLPQGSWLVHVDTGRPAPQDIVPDAAHARLVSTSMRLLGRAMAVLAQQPVPEAVRPVSA